MTYLYTYHDTYRSSPFNRACSTDGEIPFGNFVEAPPSYLGETTATTIDQTLPKGVTNTLGD